MLPQVLHHTPAAPAAGALGADASAAAAPAAASAAALGADASAAAAPAPAAAASAAASAPGAATLGADASAAAAPAPAAAAPAAPPAASAAASRFCGGLLLQLLLLLLALLLLLSLPLLLLLALLLLLIMKLQWLDQLLLLLMFQQLLPYLLVVHVCIPIMGLTGSYAQPAIRRSLLTKGSSFLGGHPCIRQTGRVIQSTTTHAKAKQRAIRHPLLSNHCMQEEGVDEGSRSD